MPLNNDINEIQGELSRKKHDVLTREKITVAMGT